MLIQDRHRRRQAGKAPLTRKRNRSRAARAAAHDYRAGPPYGYGYIGIGARDRAAVVAVAITQIFTTAESDELLTAITSLLRDEFADEHQQAIRDQGLADE
jgi:hypothetical protein